MRCSGSKSQMLVFGGAVALLSWTALCAAHSTAPTTVSDQTGTLLANPAPIERGVDALVRQRTRRILLEGSAPSRASHPLYPADIRDAWGTADVHPETQPLASVEVDAPGGVQESSAPDADVPLGLEGVAWAALHPGEIWRLFTPIGR
jgi:hypothetical protein